MSWVGLNSLGHDADSSNCVVFLILIDFMETYFTASTWCQSGKLHLINVVSIYQNQNETPPGSTFSLWHWGELRRLHCLLTAVLQMSVWKHLNKCVELISLLLPAPESQMFCVSADQGNLSNYCDDFIPVSTVWEQTGWVLWEIHIHVTWFHRMPP